MGKAPSATDWVTIATRNKPAFTIAIFIAAFLLFLLPPLVLGLLLLNAKLGGGGDIAWYATAPAAFLNSSVPNDFLYKDLCIAIPTITLSCSIFLGRFQTKFLISIAYIKALLLLVATLELIYVSNIGIEELNHLTSYAGNTNDSSYSLNNLFDLVSQVCNVTLGFFSAIFVSIFRSETLKRKEGR